MIILLLLLSLIAGPAYAAPGVAVVQSAAPTSNGGTQDFTLTGFGTPTCAMFFGSYGTVNGTVVNHAGLWVGFSDFTTSASVAFSDEDSASTTDTGSARNTNALQTLLTSDQTVDGTATASTITDGTRLTWADAPPSAYIITAVLFNSSAVSNCAVGSLSTATSIGGTASVAGLGWQPDVILAASINNSSASVRSSLGLALNDGGIVQYATGQSSPNASGTSDLTEIIRSDRISVNPIGTGQSSCELTSFDAGGFTCTTRDNASANTIEYLVFKLATGVSAKLLTCTTPTATGAHSCTGTGFTPQAAIMLQSNVASLDTSSTNPLNTEAFGLSAFTATSSSTSSTASDDGVASANTESMTDSKAVRLRKNAADYLTGTLTGFQADGANFDYTTVDSSARYRAVLFLETTTATVRRRGMVKLP